MGLFDRVERRIERAVNGAFARAFKAEVQPVEIAAAMRRAMDDRAAVLGHGRTIVPNLFVVELAPSDYDRLDAYSEELSDELVGLRAGARRAAALPARRPDRGALHPARRPRDRRLPGAHGHRAPRRGAGRHAGSRARPGTRARAPSRAARRRTGTARPGRRTARGPRSRGPGRDPRPHPGAGARVRRPHEAALAGHRRRRLPAAQCDHGASAATTTPTSCSTTRASRGGTPRSGSPPTGRTWSRASATSARPTAPSSTASGSPASGSSDGDRHHRRADHADLPRRAAVNRTHERTHPHGRSVSACSPCSGSFVFSVVGVLRGDLYGTRVVTAARSRAAGATAAA